jgi:tRNA wybutosine-synthesizing protein 1
MVSLMIPDSVRKAWHRQHYKVVGNNSAVKLCTWTKKSLRDQGVCYKERFYGVKSHGCLQMSPAAFWCTNRCLICWRRIEAGIRSDISLYKIDEPREILEGSIQAQRQLLSGFKGFEGTNKEKFREAQNPSNIAISLVGEPTLYPNLSGLIEESHRMGMVTFLVTNGQLPEVLERTTEPRQLYISVDAPDRETNREIDRPSRKDHWERLLKSLDVMDSMSCRKVLRLTVVKGWNMRDPGKYAKLIERSGCDFVEVKAYMHVGESMKRLPRSAMPLHKEVKEFAGEVSKESGYPYRDEQPASRVVLLAKN